MRTKKGFRLRELGGDYILIGESAELVNFNNIITFAKSISTVRVIVISMFDMCT